MTRFLDIAKKAAEEAGVIHKKYFNTELEIETKKTSYDRVTVADVESEARIVEIIRAHFPEHNILGEEGKYAQTDSEYRWIIDPLDGTNNFSHGMPIFCASVALARNDEIIVGAIYDVSRDELFWAEKGHGAFLNGERISVSAARSLNEAILITGFYYDRGPAMENTLEAIKRFFQQDIIGLRRLGAAALDLCYVACGRASGFWEFELSPWDFAAGKLIVEEAGGCVTTDSNGPLPIERTFVVASNGVVHNAMLKIINTKSYE